MPKGKRNPFPRKPTSPTSTKSIASGCFRHRREHSFYCSPWGIHVSSPGVGTQWSSFYRYRSVRHRYVKILSITLQVLTILHLSSRKDSISLILADPPHGAKTSDSCTIFRRRIHFFQFHRGIRMLDSGRRFDKQEVSSGWMLVSQRWECTCEMPLLRVWAKRIAPICNNAVSA